MFTKLKQKVILVDDVAAINGPSKENVIPGRVKRSTSDNESSLVKPSQTMTEGVTGEISHKNGDNLHNGSDSDMGSFPYEFASDELCGAISPTPLTSPPPSNQNRRLSIHSDNDILKIKPNDIALEEALHKAHRNQEELAHLYAKECEMDKIIAKMALYDQASSEQLLVIERLNERLKQLELENDSLVRENRELVSLNSSQQRSVEAIAQRLHNDVAELKAQLEQRDAEIRRLEQNVTQLHQDLQTRADRITELENQPVVRTSEAEQLSSLVKEQAEELQEKTKVIKKQEQKLIDLQKTLRRELQSRTLSAPSSSKKESANNSSSSGALPNDNGFGETPSTSRASSRQLMTDHVISNSKCSSVSREMQDADGFLYMKHVLVKFILSKETEAIKLLKAVSVLLGLTNSEQKLIHDTLQWRMSWFGFRPELGRGQCAKDIPPCM